MTLEVGMENLLLRTFTNFKSMRQAVDFWPICVVKIGLLVEKIYGRKLHKTYTNSFATIYQLWSLFI